MIAGLLAAAMTVATTLVIVLTLKTTEDGMWDRLTVPLAVVCWGGIAMGWVAILMGMK